MQRQFATGNMCFHPRTSLEACPALLARRGLFDLCHHTSSRFHTVHACMRFTVCVFATGACRFAWTTATQQQQLFFKVLVHQKLRPQSHLQSLHWSQHCNKTGHLHDVHLASDVLASLARPAHVCHEFEPSLSCHLSYLCY